MSGFLPPQETLMAFISPGTFAAAHGPYGVFKDTNLSTNPFTSSDKTMTPTAVPPPAEPAAPPKTRAQLISEEYAKKRAAMYDKGLQGGEQQTLGQKSLLGNA